MNSLVLSTATELKTNILSKLGGNKVFEENNENQIALKMIH